MIVRDDPLPRARPANRVSDRHPTQQNERNDLPNLSGLRPVLERPAMIVRNDPLRAAVQPAAPAAATQPSGWNPQI